MTRSAHGLGLQKKRGPRAPHVHDVMCKHDKPTYHEPIVIEGSRAPLRPDAFCKCDCGNTCMTEQQFWQHTNYTGVCLWNSGQKPRRHTLENL